MVPTVELPPATPLTIQVTAVVVFTVVVERFTVAVMLPLVFMATLMAVGESTTEVTVALVLLEPPPPQASRPASPTAIINKSKNV